MANTVYQLEFINKLGTRRDNKVYSDLDNVIWSLKQEGFEEANEGENTYVLTEVIDSYVTEKIKTLVVIHEVTQYEGRKLPKEDVYLKDPVEDNEDSALPELVVLLSELVYDDLTKEERDDKKLKVFEKAMDAKKELENKGEL
ncbi:hypothetical protein [Staphylococcus phage phiIPLA-RODI]|uniref:Uncharacterized protein n=1 Tax=Staphylococcus phage phiIPLA-RODI TaxID=1572703 RepID=A0A0D3MV08_9CAUD|nr:hypothetical protein AVU41_gp184 [Staphylococcus phage phiIPLA-RODI]AJA42146.1 hypothetical protein [Staphylococcus phage phiIPLA-RODI]